MKKETLFERIKICNDESWNTVRKFQKQGYEIGWKVLSGTHGSRVLSVTLCKNIFVA